MNFQDSSAAAAQKVMQLANEYEPQAQQLYSDLVNKMKRANQQIKGANRWSKVAVALLIIWRFYVLLMPGTAVPTIHLDFSSFDDLESLLTSLPPTRRPTRYLLHSHHANLEISEPIRFTELHARKQFIFCHGANNGPVTLSCAGSDSAITIRAPDVHVSNLIIKACTRSAVYIQLPYRYLASSSGNTTTLSNLTLLSNYGEKGAAIHLGRGFLRLSGVNATDNYAPNGGAIYLARASTGLHIAASSDRVHGVRNVFKGNSAQLGGAIYSDGAALGVNLALATFVENVAFQAGGAIYSTQVGGVDPASLTLASCNFTANQAAQVGGAMACEGNHDVTLGNSVWTDNAAGLRGGAVWLHALSHGTLSVSANSMTANEAGSSSAAALMPAGSRAKPSNPSPSSSSKRRRGDASQRSAAASNATQSLASGVSDTTSSLGGAIFISGAYEASISDASKFIYNSAASSGGGLSCVECAFLKISDALFDGNTALSGGAAYLQLLRGPAVIVRTRFADNAAKWTTQAAKKYNGSAAGAKAATEKAGVCGRGGGGAVCIEAALGASVKVSGSAFVRNSAYTGGAVFVNLDACSRKNETCATEVVTTEFTANAAHFSGGALHLSDMSGVNLHCHPRHIVGPFGASDKPAPAFTPGPAGSPAASVAAALKPASKPAAPIPATSPSSKGAAAAKKPLPKAQAPAPKAPKASRLAAAAAPSPARSRLPAKVMKPAPAATPSSAPSTPTPTSAPTPTPLPATPTSTTPTTPIPAPFATTATPAPVLCATQLNNFQAMAVGPAARGRCSNTFKDNTVAAGYGPHVSTRVYCLEPHLLLSRATSLSSSVSASGHLRVANEQSFSYSVTPFDYFLQHVNVTVPDVSIASAAPPEHRGSIRVSSPLASIVLGEARLPNVSVTGSVGTHSIVLQARVGGRVLASMPLLIDVRMCEVGEVTVGRSCQACDDVKGRRYSFNPLQKTCQKCPWYADCRGWSIVPRQGYWHAHPRSARLHACAMPGACAYQGRAAALATLHDTLQQYQSVAVKDAAKYQRALCTAGYRGPLCGSCSAGYGRLGDACTKCGGRFSTAGQVLLWKLIEAAAIAGLVALRIYSSHEFSRQAKRREQDPEGVARSAAPALEGLVPRDASGRVTLGALWAFNPDALKAAAAAVLGDCGHSVATVAEALVLLYQLLGLLSALPIALPAPLASLASLLTSRVSLDCLFAASSSNKAFARLILTTATPLLVLALLSGAWAVFLRNRGIPPTQLRPLMVEAALLTSVQFATFYYPQIIATLLSTLSCHSIASPLHILADLFTRHSTLPPLAPSPPILGYWTQDFSTQCFSRAHLSFALTTALPLLVVLALLPPALLYTFIAHHSAHSSLTNPKLITRFGYLFTDYTSAAAHGHAAKFAGLFLLSALIQGPAYYLGAFLQLLLVAVATAAAAAWVVVNKPFVWKPMNILYALPLATASLTAATAALMAGAPTTGLLGLFASTMWVPAVVANVAVAGVLAGLVVAVVKPLLPKDKVAGAAMKLQGVLSMGGRGKEAKED